MAEWFYGKDGTQHGPVSEHEIGNLVVTGQINSQTIVWREGMADWIPMAQVPELQSYSQSGQPQPYGSPQSHGIHPAMSGLPAPTDGLSIAALICGILAIVSCYVWGLFGLPAVICGHMSLKKINSSTTPIQGKGMAIAGLICGYIGIALQLLVIVAIVFAIANANTQPHP